MSLVERAVEAVRGAAIEVKQSKDYISYATILDITIGDPSRFTCEEAVQVLGALREVLESDSELVYNVGWDIPELILRYFEEFFKPDTVGTALYVHNGAMMQQISRISYVLCEQANPKELFLKACELIAATTPEDVSNHSEPSGTPDGPAIPSQKPEDSSKETDPKDPANAEPKEEIDTDDIEFHDNIRIYTLFEYLHYSLGRIKSPYPSRFFATAAVAVLTFARTRLSNLGAGIIGRRMFLLARDFDLDLSEADEKELAQTRRLVTAFVTNAAEVILNTNGVKWTQRLYYELLNRVAQEPLPAREHVFYSSLYTGRVLDAFNRTSQLALSYDMDPMKLFKEEVAKQSAIDAATKAEKKDQEKESEENEEEEEEAKDEDEDELDTESDVEKATKVSYAGLFLMMTQLHQFKRHYRQSLKETVNEAIYLYHHSKFNAGTQDAIVYWSLWASTGLEAWQVKSLEKDDYLLYLQILFSIASNAAAKEIRHIVYSVIAKLLRLQDPDVAYEFIIDTLSHCPYENVLDAAVQMLKMLVIGKTRATHETDLASRVSALSVTTLKLDEKRKLEVAELAEAAIDDVISYTTPISPYVLSWMNFLTVVDTDRDTCNRILLNLGYYLKEEKSKEDINIGILTLAAESLTTKMARPATQVPEDKDDE